MDDNFFKNEKSRHHMLPSERMCHNYNLGKGLGPESNQAPASRWHFTGNVEDTEIRPTVKNSIGPIPWALQGICYNRGKRRRERVLD